MPAPLTFALYLARFHELLQYRQQRSYLLAVNVHPCVKVHGFQYRIWNPSSCLFGMYAVLFGLACHYSRISIINAKPDSVICRQRTFLYAAPRSVQVYKFAKRKTTVCFSCCNFHRKFSL